MEECTCKRGGWRPNVWTAATHGALDALRHAIEVRAVRGYDGCMGRPHSKTDAQVHGSDPDKRDEYGHGPLVFAALHGHLEVCAYLCSRLRSRFAAAAETASLPAASSAAFTLAVALAKASARGHEPVVALLLREGANPCIADPSMPTVLDTPLHKAAAAGAHTCAHALMRAGADPRVTNARGATPAMLAREHGHAALADALEAQAALKIVRQLRLCGIVPAPETCVSLLPPETWRSEDGSTHHCVTACLCDGVLAVLDVDPLVNGSRSTCAALGAVPIAAVAALDIVVGSHTAAAAWLSTNERAPVLLLANGTRLRVCIAGGDAPFALRTLSSTLLAHVCSCVCASAVAAARVPGLADAAGSDATLVCCGTTNGCCLFVVTGGLLSPARVTLSSAAPPVHMLPSYAVAAVCFSACGRLLVCACIDGHIGVWDAAGCVRVCTCARDGPCMCAHTHESAPAALVHGVVPSQPVTVAHTSLSNGCDAVAVGCADGTAYVYVSASTRAETHTHRQTQTDTDTDAPAAARDDAAVTPLYGSRGTWPAFHVPHSPQPSASVTPGGVRASADSGATDSGAATHEGSEGTQQPSRLGLRPQVPAFVAWTSCCACDAECACARDCLWIAHGHELTCCRVELGPPSRLCSITLTTDEYDLLVGVQPCAGARGGVRVLVASAQGRMWAVGEA